MDSENQSEVCQSNQTNQTINDKCSLLIEISRLIARANRLTSFYILNTGC